jgi:serine protease Do
MKCHVTAGLALVAAGAHLAIAQMPGKKNPLTQLSGSIRQLTNHVSPAVVEILVTGYATVDDEKSQTATRISRQSSSGSGVIVDPAGYIMTNAHVVQGAVRLQVLIPEVSTPTGKLDSAQISRTRSMDARVIGMDSESDLALIRIGERGLPSLLFGDSDRLRQGDLVFAIGSPMGLCNSISMGVVSSPARAVSDDNPILYIQTDASINPGNSGGALVDTQGLLIGLNTFIVSRSGGNEGLGFAIPSNVVRNVFEQLKNKGKVSRGSIGLFVQDISPVMAKGLGLPLPQGVVIADVEPDSPGDIAGFKRRDIILSLNTHAVETARQFDDDIYRRQGGETITLAIQRGDNRLTVSARVKEQSAPWDPLASLASPEKNLIPRLGILCIEIDKNVARLLPGLRRSYGIIVAARASQGQTQLLDLQQGDIIQAVNNLPIAVLSSFQEMIAGFKHGDAVVLQIERASRLQYIAFEME